MRYLITITIFLVGVGQATAQPNCEAYKYEDNQPCYDACVIATTSTGSQGSRVSQEDFDKAINLCPTFAYAYFQKAIPYLKRGDFITWKKIIDQAVNISPSEYLGYRGWCRYQFVRDYEGAIRDFNALEQIMPQNIGYSINGDYHLTVVKALCYKAIGDTTIAIRILEDHVSKKDYSEFTYDFLHLGVMKFETGKIDEAISDLNRSIRYNPQLAESHYYLGLCFKAKKKLADASNHLQKALELYQNGNGRFDPYTHPMDKIFVVEIEEQLKLLAKVD